ncbi:MAG: hypothetical protein KC420_22195, partial [Myxococcales bacterium]|nr:hypothetical protein [Myxococcales bacterium]
RWGEYRRVELDPETLQELPPDALRGKGKGKGKGEKRPIVAWRRRQVEVKDVAVPLDAHRIARGVEVADRVWLQGRLADAGQGDGTRALSLFLVNRRIPDEVNPREQTMLFQVEYRLRCAEGILPRPDLSGEDGFDLDDRVSDLQYRRAYEYVVGHGVAARAVLPEGAGAGEADEGPPRAHEVEIAWIPDAEFKPVAARSDAPVQVSMVALGRLKNAADVEAALGGLPRAYEAWIRSTLDDEFGAKAGLSAPRRAILDLLVRRARKAAARIRAGIDLLARDKEVRQAFVFANR